MADMKKVIIVDDEKMIRVGIKRAISWEKLGIDRVFLAENARRALEIIMEERPQLMITDINMPDSTGLELIKKSREYVPELRVIVLTGYDNFEYVRDSLRLAVNDFFLKPVDEDVLIEAIKKQMQSFEVQVREKQSFLKQTADEYKQVNLGLRKLLKGGNTAGRETLPKQFEEKKARNIILLVADDSALKEEQELKRYEMVDLCNGFLDFSQGELAFFEGAGGIVILMNRMENGEEFTRKLRQMKSVLASETGIRVQVVKGKAFDRIEECVESYKDAKELSLYCSRDSEKESQNGDSGHSRYLEKVLGGLIAQISEKENTLKDALEICGAFEKKSRDEKAAPEVLEYSSFYLASAFYYSRKAHGAGREAAADQLENFLNMIQSGAPEDIYLLLKKYVANLYQEEGEKVPDFIHQAKMMIADSLTEDISVNSIAAKLYISPGYLSRVFKASTGESCNNYIVRKRLEKAKGLLVQTDIPSGKIAGMIGYKDSNYFSLAFKKSTGFSPQQYRQKYVVKREV